MKLIDQSFKVLTPQDEYLNFAERTEQIARVCYKSENKIDQLELGEKFTRSLIKSGHEAMLEHCSLTIKFVTDRATANALVRHRHCAFAQESTHFIPYAKRSHDLTFIKPIGFHNEKELEFFLGLIEAEYFSLSAIKEPTKALRSILPLCFKTEIVMTTNMREWRSILKLRTTEHAHPQMRDLMKSVLHWFKKELPIFVEDINV